jgi:HAE1 family hydrophobic/amphiphilic exporter-1
MWVLGATLRWRLAAMILLAGLTALTVLVPYRRLGMEKMPAVNTRQVEIKVILDQDFDMDMARDTFDLLQAAVNAKRDLLGIKNVFVRYDPSGGSIDAFLFRPEELPPGKTLPYSTEEVMDILWQGLPARLPGVELRFSVAEAGEGQSRDIRLFMRGGDAETLGGYAEAFQGLLGRIPNLSDVQTDAQKETQEVQMMIDEPLAGQMGVNPLVLARTVDLALRGLRLAYLKQGGREIPVWAQFREEDRKSRANLDNVAMLGASSELVPLNRLVTFHKAHSAQSIRRVNSKNVVTLTGKAVGENLGKVKEDITNLIAAFRLPAGYSIEMGDELAELDTNVTNFITALVLSVLLVYIVMGALFESYVLPLSILVTVPLAFIGVYWVMYLTGTPMDTVAMIGCILLVGVIVNNGIVIVDHINQLRKTGLDRDEAILLGGHHRLRPVMMTALTTILGCVPLALGGTIGGELSFNSLGRTLIGGLTAGTILTLVIVPLVYSLIDDLRLWFLKYFATLADLGKARSRVA